MNLVPPENKPGCWISRSSDQAAAACRSVLGCDWLTWRQLTSPTSAAGWASPLLSSWAERFGFEESKNKVAMLGFQWLDTFWLFFDKQAEKFNQIQCCFWHVFQIRCRCIKSKHFTVFVVVSYKKSVCENKAIDFQQFLFHYFIFMPYNFVNYLISL